MKALIDADFLPYYCCYNKTLEDGTVENKTAEDCIKLVDDFIKSILTGTKADEFIIVLTKTKCFRYKIYPEYKAKRKGDKPPHFQEVMEHLEKNYKAFYLQDYEADDIVVKLKECLEDSIIVSPDKDIVKCIPGKHYNPRTNEFVETYEEEANFNFWKSMIVGDSVDNIKGIEGFGDKTADKILNSLSEISLRNKVLDAYVSKYGEFYGIELFHQNYRCLKIGIESYFEIPFEHFNQYIEEEF